VIRIIGFNQAGLMSAYSGLRVEATVLAKQLTTQQDLSDGQHSTGGG